MGKYALVILVLVMPQRFVFSANADLSIFARCDAETAVDSIREVPPSPDFRRQQGHDKPICVVVGDLITDDELVSVGFGKDSIPDQAVLSLRLTGIGAKKLERMTHENVGGELIFVADGEVISNAIIAEVISDGRVEILSLDYRTGKELYLMIKAMLPNKPLQPTAEGGG